MVDAQQMRQKPAAAVTPRCRQYLPLEERAAVNRVRTWRRNSVSVSTSTHILLDIL